MDVLSEIKIMFHKWRWGYFFLAIILCIQSPLNAQNEEFITLKERYFAVEIESGLILNHPAHSIGFGMGFVRNDHIHLGLSLHFMINKPSQKLNVGYEELTKFNLLGINTQYRKHFKQNLGGLLALSANVGTSIYNKVNGNTDVTTASGFTAAVKPKMGLFYQVSQRARIYMSAKYLYSHIFRGQKSFRGLPLLSVGLRFSEISY